jgi:hypothetical protein
MGDREGERDTCVIYYVDEDGSVSPKTYGPFANGAKPPDGEVAGKLSVNTRLILMFVVPVPVDQLCANVSLDIFQK